MQQKGTENEKTLISLFIIIMLLSLFSCKKQEDINTADIGVAVEDECEKEYPLSVISADDIGEVKFALINNSITECSATYSENGAVKEIIEFLNGAAMSGDLTHESNKVGNNPPYSVKLFDKQGAEKYSVSFTNKLSDGYYCCFDDRTDDNADREFYIDSEYLYDLILHIATLDGREPMWVYSRPFEDIMDRNNLSAVVFEHGDTVKELTDKSDLTAFYSYFHMLCARTVTDEDESWKDVGEEYTASFYNSDRKLVCKFVTNGYIEDDNRYQLMFYVGDDTKGTQYAAIKRQFDIFMNYAKGGFDGYM